MGKIEKECLKCNKKFITKTSEVSRGKGKYCCYDCGRQRGKDHYLWKGGAVNRKAWFKKYKEKYPERISAREMISTAIKRNKITRMPCVTCGEIKSEAHHEDYSKPMDVIWLCRKHHREADKKLGIGSADFK